MPSTSISHVPTTSYKFPASIAGWTLILMSVHRITDKLAEDEAILTRIPVISIFTDTSY